MRTTNRGRAFEFVCDGEGFGAEEEEDGGNTKNGAGGKDEAACVDMLLKGVRPCVRAKVHRVFLSFTILLFFEEMKEWDDKMYHFSKLPNFGRVLTMPFNESHKSLQKNFLRNF